MINTPPSLEESYENIRWTENFEDKCAIATRNLLRIATSGQRAEFCAGLISLGILSEQVVLEIARRVLAQMHGRNSPTDKTNFILALQKHEGTKRIGDGIVETQYPDWVEYQKNETRGDVHTALAGAVG